jgi:hypothetical protein
MSFNFFDIEFFKYFFRVLHEARSSWLKFGHAFQYHPVYNLLYKEYHYHRMSAKELKMQPIIRLHSNPRYGRGEYSNLLWKCIVGCIFNTVGLIITREIPCTFIYY